MRSRIVRHHLPLAVVTLAALLAVYVLVPSKNPKFRWSMATAYVGLALIGATLALGPLNVLRRRPNPVSSDLRRDVGIWAGVLSIVHFVVGWQVHMKHRYLYWLREVKDTGALRPRTDLFGFANYTGLVATIIAAVLVALSNDYFLRRLGTTRWKWWQRWNYGLLALVVAHGVAFQVIEKRRIAYVVGFTALLAATAAMQYLGVRAVRGAAANPKTSTRGTV